MKSTAINIISKFSFIILGCSILCTSLYPQIVYAQSADTYTIAQSANNYTIQEQDEIAQLTSENIDAQTGTPVIPSNVPALEDEPNEKYTTSSTPDTGTLSYQELTVRAGQYNISAAGNMPENAQLSVKRVYNTSKLEEVIGNEDYTIYAAFDIEILVDGEVWQPVNDNETVAITATNINIPEGEELKVYRVEDVAIENPNVLYEGDIVELDATVNADGNIEVETEHFTTYTFGSITIVSEHLVTYLQGGISINRALKKLSGQSSATETTTNTTVKKIEWDTTAFTSDTNLAMSTDSTSAEPVYARFDESTGTIYLWTAAEEVYFNKSSSDMFAYFKGLKSVDLTQKINTSVVQNMQWMFFYCNALETLDLSRFDTSEVTNMDKMFLGCKNLTLLDLGNTFDTSNVTSMWMMFDGCSKLTSLDVSGFNTSNVTNMIEMFGGCSALTSLDVSHFNTSNVTNMYYMFTGCSKLTSLDVSHFNTSNVTVMSYMFHGCSKLTSLDVSHFNTSAVTTMAYMFYDCSSLTSLDVSHFDTSNVKNMESMFSGCSALTSLNLSNFNTNKVTNMSYMFSRCKQLTTITLGENFITGQVTNMRNMFGECSSLTSLDLSSFDLSGITAINQLFGVDMILNAKTIKAPKTLLDTQAISLPVVTGKSWYIDDEGDNIADSKTKYTTLIYPVTNKSHTYVRSDAEGFDAPIIKAYFPEGVVFNVAIKNLVENKYAYEQVQTSSKNYVFTVTSNVNEIKEETISDIRWTTEDISSTGINIASNEGEPVYARVVGAEDGSNIIELYTEADVVYFNPKMKNMFFALCNLKHLHFLEEKIDTSLVTDMSSLFSGYISYRISGSTSNWATTMNFNVPLEEIPLEKFNTSAVTGMSKMFTNCSTLKNIDLATFDTSNVTNMGCMFMNCSSLTTLDVSGFNTANVTDMSYMFSGCTSLTSVNFSELDTSNVTAMDYMFYNCSSFTSLDVSELDTSNVTGMSHMFAYCSSLTSLDASGFDTSKVISMNSMFGRCTSLTSLDVSEFDTSKVTTMSHMFFDCSSLTNLDVSGTFSTANVTDMTQMFESCSSLTSLDVSGFNTANVTTMYGMFNGCSSLTSLDVSGFVTSNITDMNNMFRFCKSLTSLDVSGFDTLQVTNISYMFYLCSALTSLDVSGFDTSNVTDMSSMFSGCESLTNLDVSGFNTSNVTKMSTMFNNCSSLTALNVSGFDTSNVTDMNYMFSNCSALTSLDVSNFDLTKITAGKEPAFSPLYNLTILKAPKTILNSQKLVLPTKSNKSWYIDDDGDNVADSKTKYTNLIYPVTNEPHVYVRSDTEGFAIPTTASYLVSGKEFNWTIKYIASPDTNELGRGPVDNVITDIVWVSDSDMFTDQTTPGAINLAVSGDPVWARRAEDGEGNIVIELSTEADKVYLNQHSSAMFASLHALANLEMIKTKIDTSMVKDFDYMFAGSTCATSSISGSSADNYVPISQLNLSSWDTTNARSMRSMFEHCKDLESIIFGPQFLAENVTDMYSVFKECSKLETIDFSHFNATAVKNMSYMFRDCSSLKSLNLSTFDTSNVTDMSCMFYGCNALTSLNLGANFSTSNVTNMSCMFSTCSSITEIDLGDKFDTSSVTDINSMFTSCSALMSLSLGNKFDTSKVSNMMQMFRYCDQLRTLYLGEKFVTSNVTNMSNMFERCESLASLDVSRFDTSKVTNMAYMFSRCESLTSLDVSGFNTSNVTDMSSMFYDCKNLTALDVSRFDVSKVTWMSDMFCTCRSMTTVVLPDNLTKISDRMFSFDTSLSLIYGGKNVTSVETNAFNNCNTNTTTNKRITLADYKDLTASCWREYDWAGNKLSVMQVEVSVPATVNIGGNENVDIDITKYLEDDSITISMPNEVVLTSQADNSATVTYKVLVNDASTNLTLTPAETYDPVEYSESDWSRNIKRSSYSIPFIKTDVSNASTTGLYNGNIALTFSR